MGLVTGCVNPIGASQVSTRVAYRQATANALEGEISSSSRLVLHRFDLEKEFYDDPPLALKMLHDRALQDERRDTVFALAELSYFAAQRFERSPKLKEPKMARDYFLSAAVYAYIYAFGPRQGPPPNRFDERSRIIRDVYNVGLSKGLAPLGSTNAAVLIEPGERQLPPGRVEVRVDTNNFPFSMDRFEGFLSADRYLVRGLTVRNRQSGVGAPLIGLAKLAPGDPIKRRVPVTVFGRVAGDLRSWRTGGLVVTLEPYSGYGDDTVKIDGVTLPLETDLTAPLAYSLNDSFVWGLGMGQFFSSVEQIKSDVYLTQPYQPGRVPIVFVHGTFSSPVWWAEMMNTLRSDPEIRQRCQIWYFIYNSGNPVAVSAIKLREALTAKVKQLDPEGKDPALQNMVVIGHSQGGLLTKLTATDSGDKLWKAVGIKSLENSDLSKQQLEMVRKITVYEHLPFVKRVVFISTPHRGSYLSTGFARSISRKLVALPNKLIQQAKEFSGLAEKLKLEVKGIPTSLDSMSESNKFLLALAEIPPAPGIKCNSIIAVEGEGDYHEGKDGLVAYPSAHVDYAESEYIVRSFHSCQEKPATIEEVRRILLKHLDELPPLVAPVEPVKTSGNESRPGATNAPAVTEPK